MEEELLLQITQLIKKPFNGLYIAMSQFETVSELSYVILSGNKLLDYDKFGLSDEVDNLISEKLWEYLATQAKSRGVNFLFWEYDVSSRALKEETMTVRDEKEYLDLDFDELGDAFFAEVRK